MTIAQRRAALPAANSRRSELAMVRRQLRADPSSLPALLLDPPACVASLPLADVALMPASTRRLDGRGPALLGMLAIRDGINLMQRLDRASPRMRQWVADHAVWRHDGRRWLLEPPTREEAAAA